MPEQYPLTCEVQCLNPDLMRIYIDEWDDLTLDTEGQTHRQINVHRAFPINAPDRFIILKNSEGKEVGIIEDINMLDNDSRIILEAVLAQTYFMPCIIRILHVETKFHIPRWDVETDRGARTFEIPSSRRDVRLLDNGRVLLRDSDGNRYEIKDYRKLDPESRSFVDALI